MTTALFKDDVWNSLEKPLDIENGGFYLFKDSSEKCLEYKEREYQTPNKPVTYRNEESILLKCKEIAVSYFQIIENQKEEINAVCRTQNKRKRKFFLKSTPQKVPKHTLITVAKKIKDVKQL
ncbi:uncharacterized protein LOC135120507 [Zophobas morio]|uniref:uncharacterized protein LOC135120507 n=1 Tax=Zophobas morio TaxID=2755281 RepID=UPI0030834983